MKILILHICMAFLFPFSANSLEPLYRIQKGDYFGYQDRYGRVVLNPSFSDCQMHWQEELAWAAHLDSSFGFINRRGEWALRPAYSACRNFSEGLAAVKLGQYWGYISPSGKVIIPFKYDRAYEFSNGVTVVEKCPPPPILANQNFQIIRSGDCSF